MFNFGPRRLGGRGGGEEISGNSSSKRYSSTQLNLFPSLFWEKTSHLRGSFGQWGSLLSAGRREKPYRHVFKPRDGCGQTESVRSKDDNEDRVEELKDPGS